MTRPLLLLRGQKRERVTEKKPLTSTIQVMTQAQGPKNKMLGMLIRFQNNITNTLAWLVEVKTWLEPAWGEAKHCFQLD